MRCTHTFALPIRQTINSIYPLNPLSFAVPCAPYKFASFCVCCLIFCAVGFVCLTITETPAPFTLHKSCLFCFSCRFFCGRWAGSSCDEHNTLHQSYRPLLLVLPIFLCCLGHDERKAHLGEEISALKLRLEGQRRAIHELEHQAYTLREEARAR